MQTRVLTFAVLALALLTATAAQANHAGPLAGEWHLDSGFPSAPGEGTADSSGHSLSAISAAPITLAVDGRFGPHLAAANAGLLNAGPSPLLGPAQVTQIAWVRHAGTPPQLRYIAGRGGEGPGQGCTGSSYALYTGAPGHTPLSFYIQAVGPTVYWSPAAAASVWDGNWHMVAGVFDGSAVQLYVDGVPAGAPTPAPGAQINYALASSDFTIDGYPFPACGNADFPGGIDEVRTYDRALSPTEISRLAAHPGPDPPTLVADDFAAPETQITTGPAEGAIVGDVPPTFEFRSSEAGSSFQCRTFDPEKPDPAAQAWAACSSPHTRTDLTYEIELGEKSVFEVRAIDAAGNVDPSPASRGYRKHGDAEKKPLVTKCEPVAVETVHGSLVRSNCRIAEVEGGKVPCVHITKLKPAECRFARKSGSWLISDAGDRWAVVGQSITKRGKKNGKYVVAAPVGDKKTDPCAGDLRLPGDRAGRDTTGTASSTPLSGGCNVEKMLSPYNAHGRPLINFATREVCTSTYPHPDGATLTRVAAPGIYCYTGRGAALNDPYSMERDPTGRYYNHLERDPVTGHAIIGWNCHMAVVSSTVSVFVAKRPANAGRTLVPNSALVWRPIAPLPIAN